MQRLERLGARLSATAHERRKQVSVRLLLTPVVAWALYGADRSEWIVPFVAAVFAIQAFEILALFRFRRSTATPTPAEVVLALASTFAMATLFAGTAVAIWSLDARGVQGFAMLIIAGGLLTNVASGIEARSIFFVGATPYLLALVAMPLMAMAGSQAGDPVLTSLGSVLFIGAILNVYGRVHAARIAELQALANSEMRVQQAETAMADRAAMAAIISHELRTPVSAIQAGAQVMLDDTAPARRRETAELIVDASALMTRMLNDLLDHSKMEAGAMALDIRSFDLARLVTETTRFWDAQAQQKGLELNATSVEPGLWLRGDPYRLRQILNNLLSNAIKFTAEGTVDIAVGVRTEASGLLSLSLTVQDQGAGISADAMERLFTPFAQGSSQVARNYGGTGLGLKVSRDLARLMGGELTVVSAPGRGAAFTLTLQLPAGEATADDGPTADGTAALVDRLRVLAVDDHEINRRTLALVLQPLGVDLTTASDGFVALELLERQTFEVVLMDVNMPGIDGNETTRRLRDSPGPNRAVPVIGFSAGTEADQIAACLDAGMTDWLAKPLEPHKLYAALRHATDPQDQPRKAA